MWGYPHVEQDDVVCIDWSHPLGPSLSRANCAVGENAGVQRCQRSSSVANDRGLRPRGKGMRYVDVPLLDITPQKKGRNLHNINYRRFADCVVLGPHAPVQCRTTPQKLSTELLQRSGFQVPVFVECGSSAEATRAEIGLKLPPKLDLDGVVECLGPSSMVPTMNVVDQGEGPKMRLAEWAKYFRSSEEREKRLLNVVSMDVSASEAADLIRPPTVVRELDLVTESWPENDDPSPNVLVYCLMGPATCYTDWHIDFGGSSVWYHVVQGQKVFLLAPPSPDNLAQFKQWSLSAEQSASFLGDTLTGCMRAVLNPGDTMLIPSGWLHAVVTPMDSIVFGGNFLHSLDFRQQLSIWQLEEAISVAAKFRFPLYKRLMWHAAVHFTDLIEVSLASPEHAHGTANGSAGSVASPPPPPLFEQQLSGLEALVSCLGSWKAQGHRGPGGAIPSTIPQPYALLDTLSRLVHRAREAWGYPDPTPAPASEPQPFQSVPTRGRRRGLRPPHDGRASHRKQVAPRAAAHMPRLEASPSGRPPSGAVTGKEMHEAGPLAARRRRALLSAPKTETLLRPPGAAVGLAVWHPYLAYGGGADTLQASPPIEVVNLVSSDDEGNTSVAANAPQPAHASGAPPKSELPPEGDPEAYLAPLKRRRALFRESAYEHLQHTALPGPW